MSLAACLGLAGLTHRQGARWHDDETLWCHALTQAPEKPRPLINCALALMRAGHSDRALPLLERAAVAVEHGEPNRRAALRSAVIANRVLALIAVQRHADARRALEQLDHTDPRYQRFTSWVDP